MKRILLTSTALVAFAGAAAAEVNFSGDAKIGFNDVVENGFYWSVGMTAKAEAELNSGLVAGFTLDVDIKEGAKGTKGDLNIAASDYVLYLKSDNAGLYFGDTDTATESLWKDADGVKLGFVENGDLKEDAILRGEGTFGNATVALSAAVAYANEGTDEGKNDIGSYQAAAKYEMGSYTIIGAYQAADKDFNGWEVGQRFGLTGMASFAGADVTATFVTGDAFAASGAKVDAQAMGLQIAYPFGPVTLGAYYARNTVDDADLDLYGVSAEYKNGPITVEGFYDAGDNGYGSSVSFAEIGVEGSYDMGNGLKLNAGVLNRSVDIAGSDDVTAYYVGGEYDMGNGAKLMASYADDGVDGNANDEVGDPEYMEGATIALSFKF